MCFTRVTSGMFYMMVIYTFIFIPICVVNYYNPIKYWLIIVHQSVRELCICTQYWARLEWYFSINFHGVINGVNREASLAPSTLILRKTSIDCNGQFQWWPICSFGSYTIILSANEAVSAKYQDIKFEQRCKYEFL